MADDDEQKGGYTWEALEVADGAEAPESGNYVKAAGSAKVTYSNGDTFQGSFNEDRQKHGDNCTYTWNLAEGAQAWVPEGGYPEEGGPTVKYVGGYSNGQKSGLGQLWYPNGDRYHGLWENGQRSGQGTYYYTSGDVYSGSWAGDAKNGTGTYVFAKDRSQLIGEWSSGSLGAGKWVFEDGTSYHGNFSNNKPIGKGVFYFTNGNQQEGEYVLEGDDEDEEVPKKLVWRGGAVVSSTTSARALTQAPLPPATS